MEAKKGEKKEVEKAKRQGTKTYKKPVEMVLTEREGGGGRGRRLEEWRKSQAEKLARAVDFEEMGTDWRARGRELGKRWMKEGMEDRPGTPVHNMLEFVKGIEEGRLEAESEWRRVKREREGTAEEKGKEETGKRRRMRRKQKAKETGEEKGKEETGKRRRMRRKQKAGEED